MPKKEEFWAFRRFNLNTARSVKLERNSSLIVFHVILSKITKDDLIKKLTAFL